MEHLKEKAGNSVSFRGLKSFNGSFIHRIKTCDGIRKSKDRYSKNVILVVSVE